MNLPVQVDQKQLMDVLLNVATVRPVFIWGAPGIGKSAIVRQFAADVGLECVSLLGSQLAPEDIIGVPQIVEGCSIFCPPRSIAREEPYCLFLDELNACSHEVQKAFYSLILERRIGEICRKSAREYLEHKKTHIRVTESNLEKYLGKEKITFEDANEEDQVGIVRGLAWTSVGGDTLQIEVNVMPGKGELKLTGQMGDVMKESAMTALTYVRSICPQYDVPDDYFAKNDIHIHIPEGAVPKDGPSAGITMATAMFSAVVNRKVLAKVAMTGEITLRGRVLPIGGLKEKILAAKMAHMETVLVPEKNRADIAELSKEITKGLTILYMKSMEDVLAAALA